MTLLLNLVGPNGIHQSSDYRLTDVTTRQQVEDQLGSKQLEYFARDWSAHVSFTGFARIGDRRTRDWVLECLNSAGTSADPTTAVASIATRAAEELRSIPQKDWFLTLVVSIWEMTGNLKLYVVSCIDRPGKPPLAQPSDSFEVSEISLRVPSELIFGCRQFVTKTDRKLLEQLNRGKRDQAEIRANLATVNARTARRSNGAVSEGCLVTSFMADGNSASENFGGVPGAPVDMLGSTEILQVLSKELKGRAPVLVQGRGVTGQGKQVTSAPMRVTKGNMLIVKSRSDSPVQFVTDSSGNTFRALPRTPRGNTADEEIEWQRLVEGMPVGPLHRIAFSLTSSSFTFNGPDGSKFGCMAIVGNTGEVDVAKNRISRVALGSLEVRAFPTFKYEGHPLKTEWDLRSVLTIDGVQPHDWSYGVHMVLSEAGGVFRVLQNSVGLRLSALSKPPSCLSEGEELVVVSPASPAVIEISGKQPLVSGVIEARLLIRTVQPPSKLPGAISRE